MDSQGTQTPPSEDRILRAATDLLALGGREAVSARAVAVAAGVQHPTIYRRFGDMQGLLDAVAEHGFAQYVRAKLHRAPAEDPVDDLREGWDLHVEFGLANPAIYTLMYGDPLSDRGSKAASLATEILERLVHAVAQAGRLTVDERTATDMVGATGIGVVLSLLALPAADRDTSLSLVTREAVLQAVTQTAAPMLLDPEANAVPQYAVALGALLESGSPLLSRGEQILIGEWLERLGRS